MAGFEAELAFERAVAASRGLAQFRRNAATWELFLLLALADDSDEAGIYQTVERVRSQALGSSALLKFIRDQTEAGNLQLETSCAKRSKRLTRLDPSLIAEMTELLNLRNQSILLQSDTHVSTKTQDVTYRA